VDGDGAEEDEMQERTWMLHSPVGVPRQQAAAPGAPVAEAASVGAALGFLSNRKPNASALQRALAQTLAGKRPGLEVRFYEKPASSLPAADELLARIAAECRMAVNGSAD
jgi:hypothetical protein